MGVHNKEDLGCDVLLKELHSESGILASVIVIIIQITLTTLWSAIERPLNEHDLWDYRLEPV